MLPLAGLLALLPSAGGLAEARADAAADARLFGDRALRVGELARECPPSCLSFDLLDRDEVEHLLDHAAERRGVRHGDLGAEAAQAEALDDERAAGADCRSRYESDGP